VTITFCVAAAGRVTPAPTEVEPVRAPAVALVAESLVAPAAEEGLVLGALPLASASWAAPVEGLPDAEAPAETPLEDPVIPADAVPPVEVRELGPAAFVSTLPTISTRWPTY
jgi:hypothetical protein